MRFYFRTKPNYMRKALLILRLFLFVYKTYSQQDPVLRNFTFRNVNYRAITFEVGGSGQYSNVDYTVGKSKGHGSNGVLGGGYRVIKSTDKILLNASANFGAYYSSSRSKNGSTDDRSRSGSFTPGFSVLNKWFSKKNFVELGAEAYRDLSSTKDIFTNSLNTISTNTFKGNRDNYFLSTTAGIGKGRLENVTSMQNAIWLNDALKKEGRLRHSLSSEELNGLGQAIVKANNTRVLDYRKRNQFILETVDQYFQQNDLIDKADIKYFSDLNDILFFAVNNTRLAGTEKYIRVMPAIAYVKTDQSQTIPDTRNNNRSTAKSARVSTGINRYIPFNIHHSNNYGIGIFANYQEVDATQKYFASGILTNELNINPVLRQAGANLFFEHAIYPNTRTVVNFSLRSEGGYEKIDGVSTSYGSLNFLGSVDYFISYRTRFTCTLGAIYQSNVYEYDYYHNLQLMPDNIQVYANAGIQFNL